MNEEIAVQADTWYRKAEQKAVQYLASLQKRVMEQTDLQTLTNDFQWWKKGHVHHFWRSLLPRSSKSADTLGYHRYISWLNRTGKLEDYLDRSISYIYMRDLGKALDSPDTQVRIKQTMSDVKKLLLRSTDAASGDQPDFMNLAGLYRWSQKESIEDAVIWLIDKLNQVASHIPKGMNAEHAQRKLMKIIIGVVLHVMDDMDDNTLSDERSRRLDEAIRLGYSYGLTYPFIDDLLDSEILNAREKEQYSQMIRSALLTGSVPKPGKWNEKHTDFIHYVYAELRDAFEYIKSYQRPEAINTFFEQSYVFFHAQDLDRVKNLNNSTYTNEELYLPVILKSSSSRLIVRSVISADEDEGFEQRTFYYGIYNQLADDFADIFEDMKTGAVTPYTYYLKYRGQRAELINPYELYWTVISYLIDNVYHSNAKAREVILNRAINGLKRCKNRLGKEKYTEIMDIFATGNPEFNRLVQRMVEQADDVDFLDKLLRDQVVTALRNSRKEKESFIDTIHSVRDQLNAQLQIRKSGEISTVTESLIDAANYSLQGDGKRLRPILTWAMGVNEYGLPAAAIMPLLKSLEYMHTASLIFDDLPSQDNASTRRGQPTLHQIHDSATAELTGLYLIQKAVEEQSSLSEFDAASVLALIRYSSQKAGEICMGQAMDLEARGKALTLEQLNTICFYKTGAAFEACLVMPAILAQVPETEIASLKKYAYHAGIAFQIKDDLLDSEGETSLLGKPVHQDVENNNSTFVTLLGHEGARRAMWEHYCLAMETLNELPRSNVFLKQILNYMVSREK
ncbi:polyprenyl synthetase family protein [Paenibacillus lentus]|uniref:Polyprenyl synthetase family protein n=1 Tax=Paenibacillus lentus TaxID=1338368 RepID=A0A3S8S036_9BACL|nr:polyprenyl synthetase family protein [Paenibacillus lentus]AZK48469.1 polyprenyl synthetase family protein [Paenibacillus lentus]